MSDPVHPPPPELDARPSAHAADDTAPILDSLIAGIDHEIADLYTGRAAETSPTDTAGEQHILFTLGRTRYAVSIHNLIEISRPLETTYVPNVPGWMSGVANLRGNVISIIDMRHFLGLPAVADTQQQRLLIVQTKREEMNTGLLVDQINGIDTLQPQQIDDPAAPIADRIAPYLRGLSERDGRLLVVLDLDRFLLSNDIQQFQPA